MAMCANPKKDRENISNQQTTIENCFALRWPADNVETIAVSTDDIKHGTSMTLRSNFDSGRPENQNVLLTWHPRQTKTHKGTVLCIHGLGEVSRKITARLAKNFTSRGYNSASITLPYHGERTPFGYKPTDFFLEANRFHLRQYFEQAVVDTLTCVSYLKQQNKPLYVVGFSLGGFVATIAAAFTKNIQKTVLVVSGGNYYEVTWQSIATKLMRKQYEENGACNAAKCFRIHTCDFSSFRRRLDSPLIPVDSTPMACFEYDPVTYAPFVNQPVLMFNARFDMFIPQQAVYDLYTSFPNPILRWITAGHWSSMLHSPRILRESDAFLQNGTE